MNAKHWMAATAAACVMLPAVAQSNVQSTAPAPTTEEARQARENARRDAALADSMEKARLKEEARPASVYIPKDEPARTYPAVKNPDTFTAKVPGSGQKAAKESAKKSGKTPAKDSAKHPARTDPAEKPAPKRKKQA